MPKDFRYYIAALAGLTLLGGWIAYGLNQQAIYEKDADSRSADYARRAAEQARYSCLDIARSAKASCLRNAAVEYRLKYRDNRRDYDDLTAQRKSALWAFIMGAAALFGMALSVIGVVLVWTTFRETREANIISREQQRARLIPAITINEWPLAAGFDIIIRAVNIGPSAALRANAQFKVVDEAPENPPFDEERGYDHVAKSGDEITLGSIQPSEVIADGSYVVGILSYFTVFGGPHFSYFCWRIVPATPDKLVPSRGKWVGVPMVPTGWPQDT